MKIVNFKPLMTCALLLAFTFTSSLCISHDALAQVSRQEAKQIALRHANVLPQHATFEKIEVKQGRNGDKYEIEFYTHEREYEYTIRIHNGNIIDFSSEKRDHRRQKPKNHAISQDEAIRIALRHADVSPKQATFTKIELDRGKNNDKYEIEFYTNHNEYEYEINAQSGKIIDFSQKMRGHHPPKSPNKSR